MCHLYPYKNVKTFLSGRDAYTLHKPRRIRFRRRKTYSKSIADLYQIDLADLSNISSYNDGARYLLLTCIDVFSKKAWAIPVRTKTGREVANAFEKILVDGTTNMVQSDKGTEFLNSTFQGMLKRRGIKYYTNGFNSRYKFYTRPEYLTVAISDFKFNIPPLIVPR